jgi:hypothetical protein
MNANEVGVATGLCPKKPVEDIPGAGTDLGEFDIEALIMQVLGRPAPHQFAHDLKMRL